VCNRPAWFDVQREGKIGYSEAQVVELDFNSNVKRVKFTFYRLKSDRDEWVEVGSPRIAPHHSYTPRPFIGSTSTKNEDTTAGTKSEDASAGVKRKIDDVESQAACGAKALVAFSKPVNDYLNTWLSLHAANPISNSDEKSKMMSDTGLSESQLDDWMRARKKANKKKDKNDGLTDEQKRENELKKKVNEEMNNYLSAWLLRPENVKSNPVAAATPNAESKEWLAKQLGVDRARIDSWFYRRRKKLKKQHMSDDVGQASTHSTTAVSTISLPQPQPQTQAMPASTANVAKPQPASQNQITVNPNLNLPSNHQRPQNQTALTAHAQVSMSLNQQLPSPVQNQVATGQGQGVSAQSSSTGAPSSKQTGLSDEAKQYLTQWLLNTSNPYPSKELKDKIMAHFGIENTRTLDGFLTRTRKKLNLQNKQSNEKMTAPVTNHSQPALFSTATQPGVSAQMNPSQADTVSRATQPSSGMSAQKMNSTQNATSGNFQSSSSASPMQSSNLDSLLTAVELVNSQKQYVQPQRSHQHGPNQKHFAPPASATGVGSPQYRQSNFAQQHQEQPRYQHRQEQPHYQQQQHQQQHHRFSHSPPMETGNTSRYQFVQNGPTYRNEQQHHFSHSPVPQYQPAQTREQSILMAYQNLQEMEIHDRSSSRSSPVEATATARQHPMQNDEGNPQFNSQAYRENQQQAYRAIQQNNIHGQNPHK
jgi:hypothetical protein